MPNTEVVVPVLFREAPGDFRQIGTGFIIAAMGRYAFVATAGHVLQEICHLTRPPVSPTLFRDGSSDTGPVFAREHHETVVVFKSGGKSFYAEAFGSWGSKAHDLAALWVEIPDDAEGLFKRQFAINIDGPKIGEEVFVFGYFDGKDESRDLIPPGFESLFTHLMGDIPRFFTGKILTKCGKVVCDYPEGTGLVESPCFSIDLGINSGMSGGPVFQIKDGRMVACGLMSHDDAKSSDDAEGTGLHAIAAKLRPFLDMALPTFSETPLTYSSSQVQGTPVDSLGDLARLGVIEIF